MLRLYIGTPKMKLLRAEKFFDELIGDCNGGLRFGGLRFRRRKGAEHPGLRHVRHGMMAKVAQEHGRRSGWLLGPELGEIGGELARDGAFAARAGSNDEYFGHGLSGVGGCWFGNCGCYDLAVK